MLQRLSSESNDRYFECETHEIYTDELNPERLVQVLKNYFSRESLLNDKKI